MPAFLYFLIQFELIIFFYTPVCRFCFFHFPHISIIVHSALSYTNFDTPAILQFYIVYVKMIKIGCRKLILCLCVVCS